MKVITIPTDMTAIPIEMLKTVLSNNPQKGFNIVEVRERIAIIDKLEDDLDDGVIILEDSEYNTLKSSFNNFPFAQAHKDIVRLADAIDNAKVYDRKKKDLPVAGNVEAGDMSPR